MLDERGDQPKDSVQDPVKKMEEAGIKVTWFEQGP